MHASPTRDRCANQATRQGLGVWARTGAPAGALGAAAGHAPCRPLLILFITHSGTQRGRGEPAAGWSARCCSSSAAVMSTASGSRPRARHASTAASARVSRASSADHSPRRTSCHSAQSAHGTSLRGRHTRNPQPLRSPSHARRNVAGRVAAAPEPSRFTGVAAVDGRHHQHDARAIVAHDNQGRTSPPPPSPPFGTCLACW
jgi:hypothetical protein